MLTVWAVTLDDPVSCTTTDACVALLETDPLRTRFCKLSVTPFPVSAGLPPAGARTFD
jgi:hypothetical protein